LHILRKNILEENLFRKNVQKSLAISDESIDENSMMTLIPIKKRYNIELYIDRRAIFYILNTGSENES